MPEFTLSVVEGFTLSLAEGPAPSPVEGFTLSVAEGSAIERPRPRRPERVQEPISNFAHVLRFGGCGRRSVHYHISPPAKKTGNPLAARAESGLTVPTQACARKGKKPDSDSIDTADAVGDKSFRIHSYEIRASKSCGFHSYKIIGLKLPWNDILTKTTGGGRGVRRGVRTGSIPDEIDRGDS